MFSRIKKKNTETLQYYISLYTSNPDTSKNIDNIRQTCKKLNLVYTFLGIVK